MVASALKDEPEGLINAQELRGEAILPSAVIYGANASGKSNFVKALSHMRMLVLDSHRTGEPGEPIPLNPFALDPECAELPCEFCADFIWNNVRYVYRFQATADEFSSESLQAWREGRRTMLFEREGQVFRFGRQLKGPNKTIEEITRNNSLFISAAAQNNHEELGEIVKFFRSISIDLSEREPMITAHFILTEGGFNTSEKDLERKILNFLYEIDTGIIDIQVRETPPNEFNREMGDAVASVIAKHTKSDISELRKSFSQNNRSLRFGHKANNGQTTYLSLAEESGGTIQLLTFIGPVFRALEVGDVVVIDEFGSRLHTRASEIILSLFNNKETNPKGAQLIVATHDTNLLSAKGLRRDQVWFTDKDESGATHLYPLSDIETRKGDNLEKGYLQGRYGAIPFAGSFSKLLKAN
jgi:AAA15 family ATPase/GTPase